MNNYEWPTNFYKVFTLYLYTIKYDSGFKSCLKFVIGFNINYKGENK